MLETEFVGNDRSIDLILNLFNNLYVSRLSCRDEIDYLNCVCPKLTNLGILKRCMIFTMSELDDTLVLTSQYQSNNLSMVDNTLSLNSDSIKILGFKFGTIISINELLKNFEFKKFCSFFELDDKLIFTPILDKIKTKAVLVLVTDFDEKLTCLQFVNKLINYELNKNGTSIIENQHLSPYNGIEDDVSSLESILQLSQMFNRQLLTIHTVKLVKKINNMNFTAVLGLEKDLPWQINELAGSIQDTLIPDDILICFSDSFKVIDNFENIADIRKKSKLWVKNNCINAIYGQPIFINGKNSGTILAVSLTPNKSYLELNNQKKFELLAKNFSLLYHFYSEHQKLKNQILNLDLIQNLVNVLQESIINSNVSTPGNILNNNKSSLLAGIQSSQIPLSQREIEVLTMIAQGYGNKEIAQKLFLTESTIELHSSRLKKKLALKNRTSLVKFACDNGYV